MHPSLQYEINRWQLKTGHRFTTELIGKSRIYDNVIHSLPLCSKIHIHVLKEVNVGLENYKVTKIQHCCRVGTDSTVLFFLNVGITL